MIDDALIGSELLLRGELNPSQVTRSLELSAEGGLAAQLMRQGVSAQALQQAALELHRRGAIHGGDARTINGYRLERPLGIGGAGVVFAARDPRGRPLALKLLREADPQKLARFERERRLQALFTEDEGFVPCLDTGPSPWGPYLIMPRMAGDLSRRLGPEPFDIDDAAGLVCELAQAIGRAHERGIVHRDLKPANILFDDRGRALIADLGLAKHFCRSSGEGADSLTLTRGPGGRGTPGYMAPEQIDSGEVGPEADVFALGAILYELLAGQPPFTGRSPVVLLAAAASASYPPLADLRPDCPRWLVRIVDRCLDPDPTRRYPSGAALAEALVEDEDRSGARVRLIASIAALALLISSALTWSLWPAPPKRSPTRETRRSPPPSLPRRPPESPKPLINPKAASLPDICKDFFVTGPWLLDAVWGSFAARHGSAVTELRIDPDGRRALSISSDGAARLWDLSDGRQLTELDDPEDVLRGAKRGAAFARGGRWAVIGDAGGILRIFDARSGALIKRFPPEGSPIAALEVDAALDRVVLGLADGRIIVRRLPSGQQVTTLRAPGGRLDDLVLGQGGAAVAAAAGSRVVGWSLDTGQVILSYRVSGVVTELRLSPGEQYIATATDRRLVYMYGFNTGRAAPVEVYRPEEPYRAVRALGFTPDGGGLWVGGEDGALRLYNTRGALVRRSVAHRSALEALAVDPKGGRVLTGGFDGRLELWSPTSGQALWSLGQEATRAEALAWSPDGRWLAVGARHDVVLRDASSGAIRARFETRDKAGARALAFAPDSRELAIGCRDGALAFATIPTMSRRRIRSLGRDALQSLGYLQRPAMVLACNARDMIQLVEPEPKPGRATSPIVMALREPSVVLAARVDGRDVFVTAARAGAIAVRAVAGQGALAEYPRDGADLALLATHPDSLSFVSADRDGRIVRRSLSGAKSEVLRTRGRIPLSLAIGPDGTVAAGDFDFRLQIWPAGQTEAAVIKLRSSGERPLGLAFAPDGRLAVGTSRGLALVFKRGE